MRVITKDGYSFVWWIKYLPPRIANRIIRRNAS